ncbi:MAG: hypothetical protein ACLFRI_02835 [Candidatus Izemoplasmataceae bacterium]
MTKEQVTQEEYIYLYSKKVKISKLVEEFVVIPSTEIVKYLKNKELYLPNYIHKAIIRKNIAPIIANADNDDKFSDEMKHRLKWFDDYTIFQLERLAESYRIDINVTEYKRDFWDIVIRHRSDLGINNLEFVKLQNLTMKYQKSLQENYETLKEQFKTIFFEPKGYFEGCKIEEAKEVLLNSTTLTDIRDLGKKYNVEIPRRINKKQLIDILALKLELSDAEQEELGKQSILELERYAKMKKVNISIELKKADMIEYILLKREMPRVPLHEESLKIFEGMNIEEYLYESKFEEITHKFNVQRKKRQRLIRNIIITVIIIVAAAMVVVFDLV